MSSLLYFIREGFKGLTRNISTTLGSIITIFLSLTIIGIFCVGGTIVNNIVHSVEDQVTITVYLSDNASSDQVTQLQNEISSIQSVQQVTYTDKNQAMENFKQSMASSPDIIDQLDGENPLPASLEVRLDDPQQVESVAGQIENDDLFKSICDNPSNPSDSLKYGQKTVERLFSLTNYIRYIGIGVIALLIFIAFVFINNTIRLAILARRKEIAIERLVGASNGFIRGPFLAEGSLQALIGAGLAVIVIELLRRFALPQVSGALMWLPINVDVSVYLIIYLLLIVAALVIGIIGSMLAMRRYLKI